MKFTNLFKHYKIHKGRLKKNYNLEENFWSKVSPQLDGCWYWVGSMRDDGYGRFNICKKGFIASRAAYQLFHPKENIDSLFICHHCDNPPCCNPHHLFTGLQKENMEDCYHKRRNVFGSKITWSIRTEKQILEIFKDFVKGLNITSLGIKYNTDSSIIYRILTRKIWKQTIVPDYLIQAVKDRNTFIESVYEDNHQSLKILSRQIGIKPRSIEERERRILRKLVKSGNLCMIKPYGQIPNNRIKEKDK